MAGLEIVWMIPKDLLRILACPETKAPLRLTRDGQGLVSTDPKSRRLYRIEDGIPVLLIDESRVLTPEEHARFLSEAQENQAYKAAKTKKRASP